MRRALALVLVGALAGSGLLAGCASQTTLLLPGEAGHPVGALVRLNKDGSDGAALNEANEALKGSGVKRNVNVKPEYNQLIAGLPLPYKTFSVTFPLGADLPEKNAEYFRFLDDVRTEIALRPGAEVQVTGHTDKQGGPNFDNIGLSRKRAEKFRDVLIKEAGFPEDQVSAVGRGSLEPADLDDDSKNRRIEVIVR